MKLLYIYDGDWPKAAVRVRKQTLSLSRAGYQVVLLSRNESREARRQSEPWMSVRRLPTVPGNGLNRLFNFPFFFNPVWINEVFSAIRKEKPHGLLVADLPLALTALAAGKLFGCPVMYDMAEVYPEFLRGLQEFKKRTWADRLIRNPGPAEVIEGIVLKEVDHSFVVSEESRERAISRGASENRVTVVGNTPEDVVSLSRPAPVPPILEDRDPRSIVLFVGILISDRGLFQAVQAIERVKETHPEVLFVVVGDGLERPRIEQMIKDRGLEPQVLLAGWQDPEHLPGFYQHSRMGLLPFLDGGQIRLTLANKLFDYLGSGLPVVASDVPPMRRVLEEAEAGVLVQPGDPESLGDGILELLNASEDSWKGMAKAGKDLVTTRYNWDLDSERFLGIVDTVVGRTAASQPSDHAD